MKKRSDGRYVKVITDPKTHKRISFYGNTVREVNQKLLNYEHKQANGSTFAEIADKWWSETYDSLAHQTLRGYKPAYKRVLDEFGSDYIRDIEPTDISRFYKKMATQGYTLKTISNNRIILNQVFEYAILYKEIQYNPCASAKMPKPKVENKNRPLEPASPEDEARILASDYPWLFPFVALLTGLRKGEILALQWKDFNFEDNTIHVTKSIEHIGKNPNEKVPKTDAGIRYVPLLDLLKQRIEPMKGEPNSYLFSDDGGKTPLSEHRYTRLYKNYQRDVGVTCTAQNLRHSYATIAVEEKAGVKELQNALGHADVTTTMNIYTAVRKRNVENLSATLNAKYSPKPQN